MSSVERGGDGPDEVGQHILAWYATILKDVGVLFQTLQLVATAMGLESCALGGGNSDRFALAANTNY